MRINSHKNIFTEDIFLCTARWKTPILNKDDVYMKTEVSVTKEIKPISNGLVHSLIIPTT